MQAVDAAPEILYHYTTADGALGILGSGTVRATMIHYMNDSQELRYALDMTEEVVFDSTDGSPEYARAVCAEFLKAVQLIAVYVFSLSPHKDQLSQWRAYAGGAGYAIGIAGCRLRAVAAAHNGSLVKCVYAVDAQRQLLAPIVKEMVSAATISQSDAHGGGLIEGFAARFTLAAATIKHPSFREEDEWRLVSGLGVKQETVRYRLGRGLVVPYTEWSLRGDGQYPIATVVVGPTLPSGLASRSLHHLTVGSFGWPVKVEFSDSPLRPAT